MSIPVHLVAVAGGLCPLAMSGESEPLRIVRWRECKSVVSYKLMKTNARLNDRFIAIAVALVWVAIVSAANCDYSAISDL